MSYQHRRKLIEIGKQLLCCRYAWGVIFTDLHLHHPWSSPSCMSRSHFHFQCTLNFYSFQVFAPVTNPECVFFHQLPILPCTKLSTVSYCDKYNHNEQNFQIYIKQKNNQCISKSTRFTRIRSTWGRIDWVVFSRQAASLSHSQPVSQCTPWRPLLVLASWLGSYSSDLEKSWDFSTTVFPLYFIVCLRSASAVPLAEYAVEQGSCFQPHTVSSPKQSASLVHADRTGAEVEVLCARGV